MEHFWSSLIKTCKHKKKEKHTRNSEEDAIRTLSFVFNKLMNITLKSEHF